MNIKRIVLLAMPFVVVFLLSSCKKSKDEEESISWTFKGESVSSTSKYIMASGDSHGNFMAAFGANYPPPYGFIGKIHPLQVGSFVIDSLATSPNWLQYRHPSLFMAKCTGTFTFTSVVNGKVSATFDLKAHYPSGPEVIKGTISNLIIR